MGILDYFQRSADPKKKGQLQKQFYAAAKRGDTPKVKSYLRRGAAVAADNNRALRDAFAQKNWHTVLLLLGWGADAHVLPGDAMGEAIAMSQLNVAKKLKARGLTLNNTNTPSNSLIRALNQGDNDIVKWVAAQPETDIHIGNERALATAFNNHRWDAVELLLKKGADPHKLPFDPLNAAIANSHLVIAKKLKSRGFTLNNTDTPDNSLMIALDQYSSDVIAWVAKQRGTNIHVGDEKPLAKAFEKRRWSEIDLLLKLGADPHRLKADPLATAIAGNQLELAKDLKARGFAFVTADVPENSLLIAMEHYGHDLFKWVAEAPETDIHVGGEKVLERAFENKRWTNINYLLDQGADPHKLPYDALNTAIASNHLELAKRLKEQHGFALNTGSGNDNSLLVALGQHGQAMIEWVATQPEINIHVDTEEPLSRALLGKKWNAAKMLLEMGADPKVLTFDPLHQVIATNNTDLAREFKSRGFALDTSQTNSHCMLVALDHWDQSLVYWLAEQPEVDIRAVGSKALEKAILKKRWPTAEFFMDQGVDPRGMSIDPMKAAVAHSATGLMKKLRSAGLSVNRATNGETPLMVAAGRGIADDVKWLLEQKADINAFNSGALVRAVQRNHNLTAKLLLESGADGTPILGMKLDGEIRELAEQSALRVASSQMAQMRRLKQRRRTAKKHASNRYTKR